MMPHVARQGGVGALLLLLLVMSALATLAAPFLTAHDFPLLDVHEPLAFPRLVNESTTSTKKRHRQMTDHVIISECLDATDHFSTRRTEGINVLKTFYDCSCQGDLKSLFTLTCVLKNYCFADFTDVALSRCVNHQLSYDFQISATDQSVERLVRGQFCVEYLQGGPKNNNNGGTSTFCAVDSGVCVIWLRNEFNVATDSGMDICGDPSFCKQRLQQDFGFASFQVDDLCPKTTMNGMLCATSNFITDCQEETDQALYLQNPDCSNAVSCASPACQKIPRSLGKPERIIRTFPNCRQEQGSVLTTPSPTVFVSNNKDAPTSTAIISQRVPISIRTLPALAWIWLWYG